MPRLTRSISTACVIALAALTGACADDANLTGPNPNAPRQPVHSLTAAAATPWIAAGDGSVTLVSDGTAGDAVMSYVDHASAGQWVFVTTAAQTGTVTLPWSYSGDHGSLGGVAVEAVVNGVSVGLLVNDVLTGGNSFSYSGTFTFNVNAGDSYGFRLYGSSDFDLSMSGTFTVHVPEQPQDPTTKDDCKDGGWEAYGFSNQGQCVAFVETGHDSR